MSSHNDSFTASGSSPTPDFRCENHFSVFLLYPLTQSAHNIPMTRENYLDVAFMGNPPEVLDAEEEYNLPEQFQLKPPENFE